MKNYYKILGLHDFNATSNDIKKAYKILARKYHPDINQEKDAAEKFKEISEAYKILNNTKTRLIFDEKLKSFVSNAYKENEFLKENIVKNSFNLYKYKKSKDSFVLKNTFKTKLKYAYKNSCFILNKLNPFDFSKKNKNGFGKIFERQNFLEVFLEPREAILGTERKISLANDFVKKDIVLKIPKGTFNESILKLKDPATNEELLVLVKIKKNNLIKIEEKGVIINYPISLKEALFGGKVKVKTFDGTCYVNIPPRTGEGNELRIPSKGILNQKGERGDFYLKPYIQFSKQKDIKNIEETINNLEDSFNYEERDKRIDNEISKIIS